MTGKQSASLKSFAKFVAYSAIGAALQWAANNYTSWHISPAYSVAVAGAIKAAMTYVSAEEAGSRE
jgi:putative flippase GtrA